MNNNKILDIKKLHNTCIAEIKRAIQEPINRKLWDISREVAATRFLGHKGLADFTLSLTTEKQFVELEK
jgi:hypothetical protein